MLKTEVIDLETYSAVYAVISGYRAEDIISTAFAVDEIRARFPECRCDDEELVGLMVHAMSGKKIAVSFDHRVEPVRRRAALPIVSIAKDRDNWTTIGPLRFWKTRRLSRSNLKTCCATRGSTSLGSFRPAPTRWNGSGAVLPTLLSWISAWRMGIAYE
ncbi:hypothetical protein [Mesorhizobium sp. L103C565B0]|uniref:hypothetical protein n=1 Tax=Mesorhizobium sp. L103C565B0 TaxID=1287094 RepID=UPI001FDA8FB3|nr:hypothetical protein [Mesorhizobium sp. L103C565B0]